MKHDLDILLDCPVCDKKYQRNGVRVVQARPGSLLVHTSCVACKSCSLAVISRAGATNGMMTMGMLTDLDYDEARWMLGLSPITYDEVLDAHQVLMVEQTI